MKKAIIFIATFLIGFLGIYFFLKHNKKLPKIESALSVDIFAKNDTLDYVLKLDLKNKQGKLTYKEKVKKNIQTIQSNDSINRLLLNFISEQEKVKDSTSAQIVLKVNDSMKEYFKMKDIKYPLQLFKN